MHFDDLFVHWRRMDQKNDLDRSIKSSYALRNTLYNMKMDYIDTEEREVATPKEDYVKKVATPKVSKKSLKKTPKKSSKKTEDGEEKPKKKRAPSAFNIYIKDRIPQLKLDLPEITHQERFTQAAHEWKEMDAEEKEPFVEKAKAQALAMATTDVNETTTA